MVGRAFDFILPLYTTLYHVIPRYTLYILYTTLQTPTMVGRVCHLSAGGRHDSMLTEDGYIIMWGSNAESQLGTGTNSDAREVGLLPLSDVTPFRRDGRRGHPLALGYGIGI